MEKRRTSTPYRVQDGSAIFTLPNGRGEFVTDLADAEAVSAFPWHAGTDGYIVRSTRTKPQQTIRLHRWLMGLEKGNPITVDHRDGDPSNNRRSNLRTATRRENGQNRKVNILSQTGIRGVSYRPQNPHRPWAAHIGVNYKRRWLGFYATKEEAIDAVQSARRALMPFNVER